MDFLNKYYETFPIIINIILFIIGLTILIKGSDFFIESAVFIARKLKVSEIVIGLTLVSIGTSLPELATNISSALKGRTAIAMGNIVGSNITNIALIVGFSCFILGKVKFSKKLFYRDTIIMIFVTILLIIFTFFFDKNIFSINKIESIIMLILITLYLVYLINFNKDIITEEESHTKSYIKSIFISIIIFLVGFIGIYAGSEIMVGNVIVIANRLNIADGVIGATVVALGTSLPELAVTFIGIIKKKHDLSLGNIIGSNIFNILFILGITGLIKNIDIVNPNGSTDWMMLLFTLPLLLIVSLLLLLFMRIKWQLGRIKGFIFILIYISFIIINYTGLPFINNIK